MEHVPLKVTIFDAVESNILENSDHPNVCYRQHKAYQWHACFHMICKNVLIRIDELRRVYDTLKQ